jgi:transaldolase
VDGITTNPTLLARETVRQICKLVEGPVLAEVLSLDAAGMVREGLEWSKVASNVVVKIPMCPEGLRTIRQLSEQGVATACTLVFTPMQGLIAAKAGASMICPFVGRLDDVQAPGMEVIAQILEVYANYEIATEVLVASIRNPLHVLESARMGADIATMPVGVLDALARHPLTDIGIERFLADWEKVKNR